MGKCFSILVALFGFWTLPSMALDFLPPAGWPGVGIQKFGTGWSQEGFYIDTTTALSVNAGSAGRGACTTSGFYLEADNSMRKDIQTIVMLAYALQKPVHFSIDGCYGGRGWVTSVYIDP